LHSKNLFADIFAVTRPQKDIYNM